MKRLGSLLWIGCASLVLDASAGTLEFAGYTWEVRGGGRGGPGPNHWDPANAWVDADGALHLRLSEREGRWYASEVYTRKRLGFGRYRFAVAGPLDRLDPNVVLGLFNYPTRDVGPDATHEIDLEFARWGNPKTPTGNYTVWPARTGLKQVTHSFTFDLQGKESAHQFTWSPTNLLFQSFRGGSATDQPEIARWLFQPEDPAAAIARKPMPVHLNLWCFQGRPPKDGRPVELVVKSFEFAPQ